jgi:predicted metal-dependent phosphotriesterase family hydrolase
MPAQKTNRRNFLKNCTLLGTSTILPSSLFYPKAASANPVLPAAGQIMTVQGPVPPDAMGICLAHEHILSRFGIEPLEPGEYDTKMALAEVTPYLQYIKDLGCQTIVDCTAAYFGRDAALLKQLSQASGMQIVTNTGYYGAANDRYVPEFVQKEKASQIARRWIDEFEKGIAGTGIKPGFIKSGVDAGPLSETDRKLVQAAALTHAATGLTIAVHTANNAGAVKEQLTILKAERVSPQAWIWVHAQDVADVKELLHVAGQGAWISLDGIRTFHYSNGKKQGSQTLDKHLSYIQALTNAGFLEQILLSHDGSSFPVGGADSKRPFDTLFTTFIPMLKAAGFTEAQIRQLTVTNPARAFTLNVRKV